MYTICGSELGARLAVVEDFIRWPVRITAKLTSTEPQIAIHKRRAYRSGSGEKAAALLAIAGIAGYLIFWDLSRRGWTTLSGTTITPEARHSASTK
jgi:hypothetical protein